MEPTMEHVSDACGLELENIIYITLGSCPNSFLGVPDYNDSGYSGTHPLDRAPTPIFADSPTAVDSRTKAHYSLSFLKNAIEKYNQKGDSFDLLYREEQPYTPVLKAFLDVRSKIDAAIMPDAYKTALSDAIRNAEILFGNEVKRPSSTPMAKYRFQQAMKALLDPAGDQLEEMVERDDGIGERNDQIQDEQAPNPAEDSNLVSSAGEITPGSDSGGAPLSEDTLFPSGGASMSPF